MSVVVAFDQFQGEGLIFLFFLPIVWDKWAVYQNQFLSIFFIEVKNVEATYGILFLTELAPLLALQAAQEISEGNFMQKVKSLTRIQQRYIPLECWETSQFL